MPSKTRLLANLITNTGDVKSANLDNTPPGGLDSAQVLAIAGADSASISTILSTSTMTMTNTNLLEFSADSSQEFFHDHRDSAGADYPHQLNAIRIKSPIITVSPKSKTNNIGAYGALQDRQQWMFERYYSCNAVPNGTGTAILKITCKDSRDDAVPGSNELWNCVGVIVDMGGHSSGVGSGGRSAHYQIDYYGASPTTVTVRNDTVGSAPGLLFSHSNFVTTITIAGSGAAGSGSFSGYCHVRLMFGRGAGGTGAHWVPDVEELI